MNIQGLSAPCGRLLWATPALPGSTHDPTAARAHGIVNETRLRGWADKACQGTDGATQVSFCGRRPKRWQLRDNSTHAKIRCPGEQTMATLGGTARAAAGDCGHRRQPGHRCGDLPAAGG
ncbi:transposase family protein [Streptomyces anulatus]